MPDPNQQLGRLWGTTVTDFELDVISHRLVLRIDALDMGKLSRWVITMSEVFSLRLDNDPYYIGRALLTEPWNYIELTTIGASRTVVEDHVLWKIDAELWETRLEVLCSTFEVAEVAGTSE